MSMTTQWSAGGARFTSKISSRFNWPPSIWMTTERATEFSTDEWLDLLVRSIGLEPTHFSRRLKLLFISRLIPMVERNYNFVELGPRGTGKSFVYREVSPYSILISGGKTTVATLFHNLATGKIGLVGLWDVVAFDEVAGIQFDDLAAVQILKDYMESGSFSRGREEIVADASMVFVGNINQPVETLVRSSHLFQPLPNAMQDMALIDRFHFFLPGWETPKMATEHFTFRYGFVVDFLAEALRDLRRHNFTEAIDRRLAWVLTSTHEMQRPSVKPSPACLSSFTQTRTTLRKNCVSTWS